MSPTQLISILKDEQKQRPHPENVAALEAIQEAIKAKKERKLFRMLQAQERGEILYFRDIPSKLSPRGDR